jgi:uncharacterized 2Fe-2S/4Fe-4S cluster protein (DUF4445 family)
LSITILPQGDKIEAKEGTGLFHLLVRHGYFLPSACGGLGTCGKCRVLICKGRKPPTESEQVHLTQAELEGGWRLACQQRVTDDIDCQIHRVDGVAPALKIREESSRIALDPGIEKIYLSLPQPGRKDQRPDTVRIQDELRIKRLVFPLSAMRRIPHILRESKFKVTITKEDEQVIDIELGDTTKASLGVALDIGTTTIAGYLLDLISGHELAVRSTVNPQRSFGADVISRIKWVYEHGEKALMELQEVVLSGINTLIRELCEVAKVNSAQVYKVTVAGNPTMLHLFTAISPFNIGYSPFCPVLRDGIVMRAEELGLGVNPVGQVYILPAISGYVGADITAGVLFTDLHRRDKLGLFVDIGTNAEIVLGNCEKMLACSTPAGPAFEGACIKYGMSAIPGAIAHVSLDNDELKLETIGNSIPMGICGSGLVDLIAKLVQVGLINEKGNLLIQGKLPMFKRVVQGERGQPQFMVSDSLYLMQQDIRELQLAKGAIRSGVELILREWNITASDIDEVYLAGAFGSYLCQENVFSIGMLPVSLKGKVRLAGNAAGQGAKLTLLNRSKWTEAGDIARRIEYFELSYCKNFNQVFTENLSFSSGSDVGT